MDNQEKTEKIYSFMKIINFTKYNESRIFDDYNDLIQHVEKYLDVVYVQRSSQWKKKLQETVDIDGSFRGIGYSLNLLIEDVQKYKNNLENFLKDINSHISEFDKIFQKSGTLSDKDDKAYDSDNSSTDV